MIASVLNACFVYYFLRIKSRLKMSCNFVTTDMVSAWSEKNLPKLLSNYNLRDIFNTHEFGLFYQALQVKHFNWREKNTQNENLVKFNWLERLRKMLIVKNCLCSLFKNLWDHVFQESDTYLVGVEHKKRAGWEQSYLKSGCVSWIGKFVVRAECLYNHW